MGRAGLEPATSVRVEIPLVAATLLGMSPEEAAKVLKQIEDTYGKVYLLWDPALQSLPTGKPSVVVLPKPKQAKAN